MWLTKILAGAGLGWPGLFVSTQVEAPFAESFDGAVTHLLILHLDGPVAVGRRVGGANLRRRVPAGGLFLHPAGQNLTVELGGELNSVHIYLADETTPVTRILAEIRQQGYTGSANLLVRYINQGRADPQRVVPSPRRQSQLHLATQENPTGRMTIQAILDHSTMDRAENFTDPRRWLAVSRGVRGRGG